MTMGKAGKNQVAVPSTEAYAAAVRVFKSRCVVQDEWGTTKFDFSTGETKNAVYRMPGKELGHTAAKQMPYVKREHLEAVDAIWTRTIERSRKRRGREVWKMDEAVPGDDGTAKEEKNYRQRYPEIRGLRYLPSTRTYFGRDPSAAGCIARLAAYRLKYGTKKKPAPFCRRKEAAKTEGEEDDDAEQQPVTDEI